MTRIVLLISLLTTLFSCNWRNAKEAFEAGEKCFVNQDYGKAVSYFNQTLKLDEGHEKALYHRGKSQFFLKDYQDALKDVNQLLTIKTSDSVFLLKGRILYHLRQYDKAVVALDKALELDPFYGNAYCAKALCYYDQMEYEDAYKFYGQAIKKEPHNWQGFYGRGMTNIKLGYYLDASHDFQQILEIDPESDEAYYGIGRTRAIRGHYLEAIRFMTRQFHWTDQTICICFTRESPTRIKVIGTMRSSGIRNP